MARGCRQARLDTTCHAEHTFALNKEAPLPPLLTLSLYVLLLTRRCPTCSEHRSPHRTIPASSFLSLSSFWISSPPSLLARLHKSSESTSDCLSAQEACGDSRSMRLQTYLKINNGRNFSFCPRQALHSSGIVLQESGSLRVLAFSHLKWVIGGPRVWHSDAEAPSFPLMLRNGQLS